MEILMDYHILFIVLSFCLLFISVFLIFIDKKTKEGLMAAIFLCGLNWVLCILNSLGFFGIGLIGYNTDGTTSVTMYTDMFPLFAIFFVLQYANVVLIFMCWYYWAKKAWDIDKDTYQKQSPKSSW